MRTFWATRERRSYMRKLEVLRHNLQAHSFVGVIGGLSFLHALNAQTKRLTLVDQNPQAIPYCQLIWDLIYHAPTLSDFLSYLTSRQVEELPVDDEELEQLPVFNPRSTLGVFLTYDQLQLWEQVYGKMQPKWVIGSQERFCFLKPYRGVGGVCYNWLIGEPGSCFENENSFAQLKSVIQQLKPRYISNNLADLDYAQFSKLQDQRNFLSLDEVGEENKVVLQRVVISNSDSTHWTQSDLILRRIIQTMDGPVEYVSWGRNLELLTEQHHLDCVKKLYPLTKNREIHEVKNWNGWPFKTVDLGATQHKLYQTMEELEKVSHEMCWMGTTRIPVLLLHLPMDPNLDFEKARGQVLSLFAGHVLGRYYGVIILDRFGMRTPQLWLEWLTSIEFHHSYRLDQLEWTGGNNTFNRNFIMYWTLRGATFEEPPQG